jgi:hypothetical protein
MSIRDSATAQLITELANPLGDAQSAQAELAELGAHAIGPVLKALPSLPVFSQRCALDLLASCSRADLERSREPSVGEVLVPLLESDDDCVREWAADVLGHANVQGSSLALERALTRAKAAGVRLDWTEAVTLRRALTDLGARQPVTPELVSAKRVQDVAPFSQCWRAEDLHQLVAALAGANQVVLYFQAWSRTSRGRFISEPTVWDGTPQAELELTGAWDALVTRAAKRAFDEAARWQAPEGCLITLEWIAETDR